MKNFTGVVVLTAALAASSAAFAQETGCVTVPSTRDAPARSCGASGVGQIIAVGAQPVTVIRAGKVLTLGAGSALAAGDRILLRGAQTATVRLGDSCTLDLRSGATATFTGRAGALCVQQTQPVAATAPAQAPLAGFTAGAGLSTPAIVGGAVIGAGAIAGALLLNQDDTRRTISQPAVVPIQQ